MGVFNSLETTGKNAADSGEKLFHSTKRYYELKIFKQLAVLSSSALKLLLVGSFVFLGMLFMTIGLAFFLSEFFQSSVLGFLTTGFLLLTIGFLTYLLRRKVERGVIQKLSATFFDEQ